MAKLIRVPALGIAIANIAINRWLVKPGARVARGDALLEVQTDKIAMEVPAEASGALLKTFFDEGAQMAVGTPLGVIGEEGEDISDLVAAVEAELRGAGRDRDQAGRGAGASAGRAAPGAPRKILATPLARRVARERGVDLSLVRGSGPGGRITEQDVAESLQRPQAPARSEPRGAEAEVAQVIPLKGARKVIADNVASSVRTSPRFAIGIEVDCGRLVALRTRLREEFRAAHGIDLTYVPFVVKAMAKAVEQVPIVNATARDEDILVRKVAHVGVAVAVEDLIFVPVIRHPLAKTLRQVARELEEHIALVRSNRLGPDRLAGGTITLTNVGVTDVDVRPGVSIIHQPQAAIVTMGRVRDRAVAVNGEVAVRPMMDLSFTYDHRVVMGVPGARYAEWVKRYLEDPESLTEAEGTRAGGPGAEEA